MLHVCDRTHHKSTRWTLLLCPLYRSGNRLMEVNVPKIQQESGRAGMKPRKAGPTAWAVNGYTVFCDLLLKICSFYLKEKLTVVFTLRNDGLRFCPAAKNGTRAGTCPSSSSLTLTLLFRPRADENEGSARGTLEPAAGRRPRSEGTVKVNTEKHGPWHQGAEDTFQRHDTNVPAAADAPHLPTEPPGSHGHRCCPPTPRWALANPGQASCWNIRYPLLQALATHTHTHLHRKSKEKTRSIPQKEGAAHRKTKLILLFSPL